ncbi:MAG: hypothetical protein RR678_01715 [Lachnospiraceae bacterium]
MEPLWTPMIHRETIVKLLFIVGIISLWVYFSGIGKFVFQNIDHPYRNTIFNLLVESKWPVLNFDVLADEMPNTSVTGMIYYIGFWLPSAVIGKLFGLRVGYYAQAVWAVLGIVLVYYFICAIRKKIVVWPLFVLIFFSGLDIVGHYLIGTDLRTMSSALHLEWWDTPYQFSSMTSQLFWVFNQAIPAWLCTMLIFTQKNNRNIVFVLACSMLTSTLPFVGLIPLVFFFVFTRKYEGVEKRFSRPYVKALFEDTCTIQNVLGGGIIGITSFLYLYGNAAGGMVMQKTTRGPVWEQNLAKWLVFIIIEIGIYCILIYKYQHTNKLYYFIILCMCVLSLIRIGYTNDFCMRATIPALFLLMLLVMDTIQKSWEKRDYPVFVALICVLVIGGVTPLHEFTRTVTETYTRIEQGEAVYAEDADAQILMSSPNFAGDAEENFFFRYLAR